MASFRALLAEQDVEYTYHIKSTRHLHDDDIFDRLQVGLLGYDLRKMERVKYDPLAAVEPMFHPRNDEPGLDRVFDVKVVLGSDVPNGVLRQKVAYFTDINWEYIVVHKEGEKPDEEVDVDLTADEDGGRYKSLAQHAKDWNATPDDGDVMDSGEAKKIAGQGRIDAFMKELETDRKAREKEIEGHSVQPQLTEAFVTSHLALFDVFGHNAPKGYYLAERHLDDTLHIQGPFKHCPENYDFIANLEVRGSGHLRPVSESVIQMEEPDRGFRFTRPLRERMTPKPFEVAVQDQDTGKVYHVVVKAISETDARDNAVEIVANNNQLDANRLIAVEPESVSA